LEETAIAIFIVQYILVYEKIKRLSADRLNSSIWKQLFSFEFVSADYPFRTEWDGGKT